MYENSLSSPTPTSKLLAEKHAYWLSNHKADLTATRQPISKGCQEQTHYVILKHTYKTQKEKTQESKVEQKMSQVQFCWDTAKDGETV